MAENSRQRGFTLVEMLVVISVISLLISMLLPALDAAREQARATLCMSNMRQHGQAIHVYTTSNKGLLIYGASDYSTAYGYRGLASEGLIGARKVGSTWEAQSLICPSRGTTEFKGLGNPLDPPSQRNWEYSRGRYGPNDIGVNRVYLTDAGATRGTSAIRTHYLLNSARSANNWPHLKFSPRPFGDTHYNPSWTSPGYKAIPGGKQHRVSEAENPAQTWASFEANGQVVYVHNDAANFLYLDGHVEVLQVSDIRTGEVAGNRHRIEHGGSDWYAGMGWKSDADARVIFAKRFAP